MEFKMSWYGRPIASLRSDGVNFTLDYENGWMLPLSEHGPKKQGALPPFLVGLLPDGFQRDAMGVGLLGGDEHQFMLKLLAKSRRLMSNLALSQDPNELAKFPVDSLFGRLKDFVKDSVFEGEVSGVPNMSSKFLSQVNDLLAKDGIPRQSGTQAKIPMCLDEEGFLQPAQNMPFTHILKLPSTASDPNNLRGASEWLGMELAAAGGVKTCDYSMIRLGDGFIGYLCERFDVPQSDEDARMVFFEDFCSVMGVGANAKFFFSVEEMGKALVEKSTDAEKDVPQFLRQTVANYILENGDFHANNMGMLKVAAPALNAFKSTRLSPAFDIMNTFYFQTSGFPRPETEREDFALDLFGRNTGLQLPDFIKLGTSIGLDFKNALTHIAQCADGIRMRAKELYSDHPQILDENPKVKLHMNRVLERAHRFANELMSDLDAQLGVVQKPFLDPEEEGAEASGKKKPKKATGPR